MFEETLEMIDAGIARAKSNGRRTWFDIDLPITGIKNTLINYYKERGYTIELIPCRACLGEKADIIITW